ncbi:MAG: sulfate adenylyltransferase [Ideonella sp.]|nr:sulfate adenylyltransferase [Ideonella sp.]MCC7458685.1 sulfate adenylyltransferase [Nitrospira sp.]
MSAVLDHTTAATAHAAAPRGCAGHRALRFLTAGSVDDGKSTLIGRLLYDSRAILADQLDTLHARAAGEPIDLSLLTDGLEAEREQRITIDVAFRYFATRTRKFIIADAPGHEQYTRNMVTAAAGSDAAVVLVDLTKIDWRAPRVQLLPQTRRHALLAQLLRVPSIVFAVNKIDAVDDPAAAFAAVRDALQHFAVEAALDALAGIVPVSALRGDNVTQRLGAVGTAGAWFDGPSLLELLEQLPTVQEHADGGFALPVQYVARNDGDGAGHQARTLWGRVARSHVRAGDTVQVLPSGQTARVQALQRGTGHAEADATDESAGHNRVTAGQSVGIVLDRQLDISRGDWLVAPQSLQATQRFAATLAWLDTEPAQVGRRYLVRHGHRWVQARIVAIEHRLDIHTLQRTDAHELAVNDIGEVTVELQQPLPLAPFADNRECGALIVVDPASHRTSGALLVRAA